MPGTVPELKMLISQRRRQRTLTAKATRIHSGSFSRKLTQHPHVAITPSKGFQFPSGPMPSGSLMQLRHLNSQASKIPFVCTMLFLRFSWLSGGWTQSLHHSKALFHLVRRKSGEQSPDFFQKARKGENHESLLVTFASFHKRSQGNTGFKSDREVTNNQCTWRILLVGCRI